MHKLYKHLDGVLGGAEEGEEQRVPRVGLREDLAPRTKREGKRKREESD